MMSSPAREYVAEIFEASAMPELIEQLNRWGANMEATTANLASSVDEPCANKTPSTRASSTTSRAPS